VRIAVHRCRVDPHVEEGTRHNVTALRIGEIAVLHLEALSHDLRVVRALANHVMVMQNGKVVEEGSAERIFEAPETDYTRALFAAAFNLEADVIDAVRQ
jgi:ABC-type dipeptide/oligopeptide/nickel transport system ATPase component